eukprot:768373-Hanusia_phi.AAC.3
MHSPKGNFLVQLFAAIFALCGGRTPKESTTPPREPTPEQTPEPTPVPTPVATPVPTPVATPVPTPGSPVPDPYKLLKVVTKHPEPKNKEDRMGYLIRTFCDVDAYVEGTFKFWSYPLLDDLISTMKALNTKLQQHQKDANAYILMHRLQNSLILVAKIRREMSVSSDARKCCIKMKNFEKEVLAYNDLVKSAFPGHYQKAIEYINSK